MSRWSGSISPNKIGWGGCEDSELRVGEDGSLGAFARGGRVGDLGVSGLVPAPVAGFGLLIRLANDAPLLACC